jgi:hypothetical protein
MVKPRTLGLAVLSTFTLLGCGGSPTEPREMTIERAALKLEVLPQQVVAVRSSDPGFAMEASVVMVARETAGVAAFFNGFNVRVTHEGTGASNYAPIVRLNTVGTVPAGGSVEVPFRVQLSSTGPYRAKVFLTATDAGGPASTGQNGLQPGSWLNGSPADPTTFESSEFRILPPQ